MLHVCGARACPDRRSASPAIPSADNVKPETSMILRRALIATAALAACAVAGGPASAQSAPKLKVGLMLPYTGTYAALGNAIENGFRLYVSEQGGKLGGREIEFFKVDDESDPAKATDNV